jgi:5-(carboxyamino)imidazole ribonucleotide synthase
LDTIEYQGFITFEVFETEDQDLYINEVAPRVHNSAHYSLEALYLNQFKSHLIAGLNLELPEKPKVISAFAMYNLIASKEENNPEVPPNSSEYFLNWYQKKQSRLGRKMGHITSLASTFDEALITLKNKARDFKI